jgi:signal transduction histidine kinase
VSADISLPEVLRRIVEAAKELLAARYAALGVIGPDGQLEQFVPTGMDSQQVEQIGALPRGRGILGLLITDPAPLRLADLTKHPASAGFPAGHPRMTRFLGVPIQAGDEVYGNLYLTERQGGGEFTAEDEELAKALGAAAGVAIANARLFAESEQRRRWLSAAGELTHLLLTSEASQPMAAIAREAAVAADADFATLAMPHEEDRLVVTAVHGEIAADLLGHETRLDDNVAGEVVRTGKPRLILDYRTEVPASVLAADVGPLIVVPVAAGERVAAVLSLGRRASRPAFTEADMSMAASFGSHAAVALELVAARVDQLQLAQLEDHDRIARDLHDHVIQEVFAVGLGLQGLSAVITNSAASARIAGYVEALDRVISQIRSTIFQLHLGAEYGGLRAQILGIVHDHTPQLGFSPQTRFSGPLDRVIGGELTSDILAVTREALSNCARHAEATAAEIAMSLLDGTLTVVVTDNGKGLGTPARTSGLDNMRFRAQRHGGTVEFTSPPEGGTRITWTALVPSPASR